jgi:phage repressor protein C with HTH and peptisase S24 domain
MTGKVSEALGPKLRRQRRRLGLTLDELAGKTGISKPYLSLIETGRVPNPPSDEKLRRLEQTLGFPAGELVTQAHLHRTPRDVREMLGKLIQRTEDNHKRTEDSGLRTERENAKALLSSSQSSLPQNLDEAYLSGVLQQLAEQSGGNVEEVSTNAVPVINKVSAGYPMDFTDLSYPPQVADDYIGCPDLQDKDAFAARVHGDSMAPKYREEDIVIFSPSAGPRNGDDCFVRFDDGHTTFKRVFFEADEKGGSVLRLQPRNERYRPLMVASEKITGVWKAVFKYQRVDEE